MVWAGRIEEGEDTQIYFKESLDGGISWEDDLRLTNSVNNSWQPRVAMVDSMKHVVWSDLRHGNRELYYKRYPDFPSDVEQPEIYNVNVTDITKYSAVVEWTTDRPCDGTVRYSENSDLSNYQVVNESYLKLEHSFLLEDLTPNTTYYFEVSSTDENGNTTVDDNDGEYYSFTTLDYPPPEIFNVSVSEVTEFTAVVEWNTDKSADSTVRYSEDPELEDHQTVHSSELVTDHSILLDDLTHNTTYFFEVSSTDEYGSTATDDNDGEYYSFTTIAVPPPEIYDRTTGEPATGDEFEFSVEVISSVEGMNVSVEYRFDDGSLNTVSMELHNEVWSRVVEIPEDKVWLEYSVSAKDVGGTTNSTAFRTLEIVDTIPPMADAGDDIEVSVGDAVTFYGSGSYDNVGIVEYRWEFSVGSEQVELRGSDPTFTFTTAGNYTVVLTVEDAWGNRDTDTMDVTVVSSEDDTSSTAEPEEKGSFLWWILLAVIVAAVVFVLYYRREKDEEE